MEQDDFEELKELLESRTQEPQVMSRFLEKGYPAQEIKAAIENARKLVEEESSPQSHENIMEKGFGEPNQAGKSALGVMNDISRAFRPSGRNADKLAIKLLSGLLAIIALAAAYIVFTKL